MGILKLLKLITEKSSQKNLKYFFSPRNKNIFFASYTTESKNHQIKKQMISILQRAFCLQNDDAYTLKSTVVHL